MQRLTSLAGIRLTLLTALGASGVIACSGTVTDHSNGRASDSDGGVETGGAGGSGSGGKAAGGTGGWYNPTDGGAANGGSGGSGVTGGMANGGYGGGTGGQGGFGGVAACNNPVPISGPLPGDPTGGYVQCEDYTIHRVVAAKCWDHIDRNGGPTIPEMPDGSFTVSCTKNADCTDHAHGYCDGSAFQYGGFGGAGSYQCNYGCTDDSECGAGQICLCGQPVGRCVEAHCKSDADCSGSFCKEWYRPSGCGNEAVFSCTPLCVTNEDCSNVLGGSGFCSAGNCQGPVCGRPFLVEGFAVLADPASRGDWSSDVAPDVSELSPETRLALAEHYTAIALMEHASVAAFARFSLELLSLGAPAHLVEAATQALSDETRHARVCFGLAAAYGGADVGPGRLATESALAATSVAERIKTAFLEACVGETLASVEAAESALRATDPTVKALLSRIADDETRHAALGFKFVKWALEGMSAAPRAELTRQLWESFDAEVNAVVSLSDVVPADPALEAHGLVCATDRRALRAAALRDVVAPCVRALLGERATRRAA